MSTKPSTHSNQSLAHGLRCLQAVAGEGRSVGVRELGRMLDMDPAKVHRALSALTDLGMVERTGEGKYRPGPGLHVLSAQSLRGSRLLPLALPYLDDWLSRGMATGLAVIWEATLCYLLHARPGERLLQGIGSRDLRPAWTSSAGIAMLGASGAPLSTVPAGEYREALRQARKTGYGRLRFAGNHISVGVAIGNPPVAGLAVSSDALANAGREAAMVAELRETADHIGRLL
jgi:DNA-binding IclR family transcriptional regulator